MSKFKDWIQNRDNIAFIIIFTGAFIFLLIEIFNFNSIIDSVYKSFYKDGIVAGIFAICGCLLPMTVLLLDGSWIYRSYKNWKW